MPRYFFHVRCNGCVDRDECGVALPDLKTAYLEAKYVARDILMREMLGDFPSANGRFFEVTDDAGGILLTVPFRHAFYDG